MCVSLSRPFHLYRSLPQRLLTIRDQHPRPQSASRWTTPKTRTAWTALGMLPHRLGCWWIQEAFRPTGPGPLTQKVVTAKHVCIVQRLIERGSKLRTDLQVVIGSPGSTILTCSWIMQERKRDRERERERKREREGGMCSKWWGFPATFWLRKARPRRKGTLI